MNTDQYTKRGSERLVREDLFSFENIVIPCKTDGRWYGQISQEANKLGVPFPKLSLCGAKLIEHGGKRYLFVALWDDKVQYSDKHIFECACSALLAASHAHLKTLAMPLLGGKEGDAFIGSMERAIDHIEDAIEPTGLSLPEITFVKQ